MRSKGIFMTAIVSAVTVSACDESVFAPVAEAELGAAAARVAADVSGGWSLSRVLQLTAPPWVAEGVFGVEPEGPITHIRCESTGSMMIAQTGATFSGTAEFANACRTRGGQVYESTAVGVLIAEGVVRGRSVEFVFIEDGFLICPHRAVLTDADALQGTGRCVVPGHPQSPVPADPPPAGTSKTITFEAWRG